MTTGTGMARGEHIDIIETCKACKGKGEIEE